MIIITGQTASGKTKLAVELAKKNNGELISVDSRQIYKYLNIVTGKDIEKMSNVKCQMSKPYVKCKNLNLNYYQIDNIKLWGLDLITPDQIFSSSQYADYVFYLLENIIPKDKTVIIVGGTYLYIKHLLYGIDTEGVKPNWQLRSSLNQLSVFQLQSELRKINNKVFDNMNHSDQNNPRRLIRKIELSTFTASSFSKQPSGLLCTRTYSKFLGLKFRSTGNMRQKITQRVNQRIKLGAIEETKKLIKMGYHTTDPGLNSIGYQQLISYINGKISKQQMIELWVTAEVQYAIRQYTFMKKDNNIKWIEI